MADDPNLLKALKLRLRREYANNPNGLKQLSNAIFAQATQTVTITQTTLEGGNTATGQITCPRATYLQAIEEVLQEIDVTVPRSSNAAVGFFR